MYRFERCRLCLDLLNCSGGGDDGSFRKPVSSISCLKLSFIAISPSQSLTSAIKFLISSASSSTAVPRQSEVVREARG